MVNYKFEVYSIAGLTILIAGLLRLFIYYKSFNISILPFIEPGEVLTIFFDNLLYFTCFWCLNIVMIWIFYNNADSISILPDKSFLQRLVLSGFLKWNKIILFFAITVLLFIISKTRNSKNFYEFYLLIGLLVVAIYINPLVLFESKHLLLKSNIVINKMTIIFLISAINLFVFASFSALNESYKVKSKQFYLRTEFEVDNNQKIISTIDYYYIGKTKGYVFFYDRAKQETDVVPVSRFTKMKFVK